MATKLTRRLFVASAFLPLFALLAGAHTLDEVESDLMGKEPYFQPADTDAPEFDLQDADGRAVKLSDFRDKIIVLNFVYTNCPDSCPLHAEKIAAIQKMVNLTPMKDQVQFISVTTVPTRDNGQALRDFGENHGLDPMNWVFLTAKPGQPETITRELAKTYGVEFKLMDNGEQMHGVLTNVIDQEGRLSGRFHGMEFADLNLVIFANALINIKAEHHEQAGPGFWDRLRSWF